MILIYITASSNEEARSIGRTLIEERLCACVNIIDNMQSIYRWQGNIEEAKEVILIVKTQKSLFEQVQKRVKELHCYEVPCVIQIDVPKGSQEYLKWISDETKK